MSIRLNAQTRYGVRAMLDLALCFRTRTSSTTIKDISRRQEVSARYLENLLAPLRIAGLVRTQKGNRGGYTLSKDPSEITLGQIVRVLVGTLTPAPCIDDPKVCNRATRCVTRKIWCELHEAILNFLYGISLADMVKWQKEFDSQCETETMNSEVIN